MQPTGRHDEPDERARASPAPDHVYHLQGTCALYSSRWPPIPECSLLVPLASQQCNQKPKFQNFEFCGKNCASTWQLAHGNSNGNPNPPAKKPAGNVPAQISTNTQLQIPSQLLAAIRTSCRFHRLFRDLNVAVQLQSSRPKSKQPLRPSSNKTRINLSNPLIT